MRGSQWRASSALLKWREDDVAEFDVGAFGLEANGTFGLAAFRYVIDEVAVDPDGDLVVVAEDLVVVPFGNRALGIVGEVVVAAADDAFVGVFDLAGGADDPDIAGVVVVELALERLGPDV